MENLKGLLHREEVIGFPPIVKTIWAFDNRQRTNQDDLPSICSWTIASNNYLKAFRIRSITTHPNVQAMAGGMTYFIYTSNLMDYVAKPTNISGQGGTGFVGIFPSTKTNIYFHDDVWYEIEKDRDYRQMLSKIEFSFFDWMLTPLPLNPANPTHYIIVEIEFKIILSSC